MNPTKLHSCIAALVLGPLVGCGHTAAEKPAAATASPPSVVRVTAAKPVRKTLVVTTTQPARIEAFETAPLYSKLAGYVETVHVDIGDKVSRNQTLVTLRLPELADDLRQKTALLQQAEAQLQQAEALVASAGAAVETADAKVAEAVANVARAKSDVERWNSEYGRVQKLVENGSVTEKLSDETRSQLHAAEAAQQSATAATKSAQASAREARLHIKKAEADVAAAGARRSVAQADLAHAKTMLDYATIRAPFDGVVTKRLIDTGHFVQPATNVAEPLLVVARSDLVRVYVDVPELEAMSVDVGDPATIDIQAVPGKVLTSPVVRTSWSLDPSNRSLRAEVDLSSTEPLLRPGMYAHATIESDRRVSALVIPVSAIVKNGPARAVCRVDDGKIHIAPVQLGVRSGQEIEVLAGVSENDTLVVSRPEALTAGQQVEVAGAR